jgi:ATP-dependent metalloprotease
LTSRIAPSNSQLIRQSLALPSRHFRDPLLRLQFRPRTLPTVSPTLICRSFSLGSLFSRPKPISSPSPVAVAHIARLEADANATPHDLSKQLSLFESLVDTGLKPGYEVVVTRWERMCEFVCAHPFCPPALYIDRFMRVSP